MGMLVRTLALAMLLGTFVLPLASLPVKPDAKRLLQDKEEQPIQYPPARAGWNGPEDRRTIAFNPTYEQMRFRYTPAGRRAQFIQAITPDWRLWSMFGFLIFTLRYYRWRKPRAEKRGPAQVIAFPQVRKAA